MARPRGQFRRGAWRLFKLVRKLSSPVCHAGNRYLAGVLGVSKTQICRYLIYLRERRMVYISTDRLRDPKTGEYYMKRQMAIECPPGEADKRFFKKLAKSLTLIKAIEKMWEDRGTPTPYKIEPIVLDLLDPMVVLEQKWKGSS